MVQIAPKKGKLQKAFPFLKSQELGADDGYLYIHLPKQMAEETLILHYLFEDIKKYAPPLSQRVFEAAKECQVKFKVKALEGALGTYYGHIVQTDESNTYYINIAKIIPHELMHWVQVTNGYLDDIDDNADYRSYLLSYLAKEAGAQAFAIYTCCGMALNGYPSALNYMRRKDDNGNYKDPYAHLYNDFVNAFNASIDDGVNTDASMLYATEAVFNKILRDRNFISVYGKMALEQYLHASLRKRTTRIDNKPFYDYSPEKAKQQTRVAQGEYLINEADLPIIDLNYFKQVGLEDLYHAFEAVEAIRILQNTAVNTPQIIALAPDQNTQALVDRLQHEGNPFLSMPMAEIYNDYYRQDVEQDIKKDIEGNVLPIKTLDFLDYLRQAANINNSVPAQAGLDF